MAANTATRSEQRRHHERRGVRTLSRRASDPRASPTSRAESRQLPAVYAVTAMGPRWFRPAARAHHATQRTSQCKGLVVRTLPGRVCRCDPRTGPRCSDDLAHRPWLGRRVVTPGARGVGRPGRPGGTAARVNRRLRGTRNDTREAPPTGLSERPCRGGSRTGPDMPKPLVEGREKGPVARCQSAFCVVEWLVDHAE